MPSITRILVPVDFSACSDAALDYAVFLARRFDAALELIHVMEWPPASVRGTPADAIVTPHAIADEDQRQREGVDAAMRERVKVAEAALVQARGQVERGEPTTLILRAAESIGCDIIVLGTHGRRGLARLVLGSVAEQIVRQSGFPVLVVHGEASA
jgi:nucleotide-binding universal stress UspA family protein